MDWLLQVMMEDTSTQAESSIDQDTISSPTEATAEVEWITLE